MLFLIYGELTTISCFEFPWNFYNELLDNEGNANSPVCSKDVVIPQNVTSI